MPNRDQKSTIIHGLKILAPIALYNIFPNAMVMNPTFLTYNINSYIFKTFGIQLIYIVHQKSGFFSSLR